jgi:recombinational DNA repair ATPase RecF
VRLVRISVENFRALRQAAIDFAPGLNVLYGPNDLGKSTIAVAIRATLLTPPSSSEAETYASWFTAENPRVELTFADNEGADTAEFVRSGNICVVVHGRESARRADLRRQ